MLSRGLETFECESRLITQYPPTMEKVQRLIALRKALVNTFVRGFSTFSKLCISSCL